MAEREAYVVDLGEQRARDHLLTGGKAAALARAAQCGLPVPRGFVITRRFFDEVELHSWKRGQEAVVDDIDLALSRLGGGPVAVRSSAIAEDGAEASFAGQHETRLNARGVNEVMDALADCWRSSLSTRTQDYRIHHGAEGEGFAVLIQEMVAADACLIAFTIDPVSGDRSHVVINAAWGLGESLVGGTTNPDAYRVRKLDLEITTCNVVTKDRMTIPVPGGTREVDVPEGLRRERVLNEDQIRRVTSLAIDLENEFGNPIDLEAAISGDRLVLLQARPVTATPSFPVDWDPPDAELTWFRGEINFPKPVSPLFASWLERVFEEGATRALRVGGPPIRFVGRRINTFWYGADVPLDLSPEGRVAWIRSSEEALDDSVGRLGDLWEREYLPEVKATVAILEQTPVAALSDERLAVHLEDALARSLRAWEIHFLALSPALVALNEFEKLCVEMFGQDGSFAGFEMLQGFDNETLAMERALQELARAATDNLVVADVIATKPTGDAVETLRRDPGAAAFLRELDAFLTLYGRRFERFELMVPTWREDPAPVIETIHLLMDAPKDPARSLAAAAERRERAVATAHARSKDLPPDMRERFDRMLAAAQAGIVITEDHVFYIDGALQFEIRRLVLECGRRLVKRRFLSDENDIFMLTLEETTACLVDGGPGFRAEIATRRGEMERWEHVKAPAMLGTPTAEESGRWVEAWASFGGRRVSETAPDGAIKGVAASGGRASGTARVLTTPRDARRLKPGDVLVVEATAPTWAPLLSSASALISERGGPLSHCAILAREYGVPAVVGVEGATRRIRDGDVVEVDGSAGLVRIIHPERAVD